ncbi:MAG TPA: BON domain-containing protein, partial [Methanomicrobiales archaeon]|nr:BON domain-containing protein [Methanomicrobiales archaeon]
IPVEIVEDQAIRTEIFKAIHRILGRDVEDLKVDVTNSVVTLSGSLADPDARRGVLMAAENTRGVVGVVDTLTVREEPPISP